MTPAQEHELALLMVASQRGDRMAYEALLQGLSHVVTLYVRRRVGPAHWVDDVVTGALEYQGCDDKVCYNPTRVPISFVLSVKGLDRRPPG